MVNYDYSLEYLYLETLIEVSDSKKMNSLLMKHIAQMHKKGFSLALYSFINGLKGKRDSETIILVFYNSLKNTLKKNIQYSEVNNEDLPDTTDVKGSKGLLVYFILSLEHEQSMIRELSRNALFYLLKNNPEYFNEIKTMFDTCTKIEAILSIIFSLIIYKLENLIYYKEFLFQCIQYHHFNIKQLAKEVLLFALQKGFSFSESEINDIHSINKIPLLIQSFKPIENSKILENYKIVTYLDIIIDEIGKYVDVNEFTDHLFYLLKKKNVFPNSGIINGKLNEKYVKWLNKSVNAISKYDEIIRESINEVLDHYILRKKLKQEDIEQLKYHVRINDPTDLLITKQTEPDYINWIALDYSDSDFLICKDLENGIEEFVTDGEWIDLYQAGYQSYGGQVKEQNKRITHYEIIGFLMNPKMHDRNSINELMDKEWPHIASNNFYRFEGEDIIGARICFCCI